MMDSLRGLATVKGRQFIIVTAVFLVLAFAVVGCRVWAKVIARRRFEIHDYLAFVALLTIIWICATGFAVDSFLCVYPGTIGMHLRDAAAFGTPVMRMTLKIFYASGFLWITSTTLVKLSLLHFYLSIFVAGSPRAKFVHRSVYTIYALSVAYWAAHITLLLRRCKPIALQWDSARSDGHCGDITKEEISASAMNLILDLSIVVLPIPVLWSLHMSLKKKIAINAVLSLGLLICVINATRLALVVRNGSKDFTYTSVNVGICSGLEVYIGLVSTSLPTLGPLLRRERLANEAHRRRFYVSRSKQTLRKSPKKSFGDSLLMTNQSFEPLHDRDNSLGNGEPPANRDSISRTREVHVVVDQV